MAQVAAVSTMTAAETTVAVPLIDVAATVGKVPAKSAQMLEKIAAENAAEAEKSLNESLSTSERDGLIKQLNKALDVFDTNVSLSVDEKSHQTIIKVVDKNTGKVIRQIPSEQLLRVSERITELLGMIYDKKM